MLEGARYLLTGIRLIWKPGLRRFALIPLLINVLLFTVGLVYGANVVGELIDAWLPDWLQWLRWILWPLLALLALGLIFFTFTLIANLIGSPFNGLLAEAVETRLGGGKPESGPGLAGFPAEAARALASEMRKLLYFAMWAIPCLILFLVPGLQLIAPVIWFLFGAWSLALEYSDFPMGNHGITFPDQRKIMAGRRPMAFGFGCAVMLMTVIPFLNFIAMPAAVAGATVMWVEQFRPGSGRA